MEKYFPSFHKRRLRGYLSYGRLLGKIPTARHQFSMYLRVSVNKKGWRGLVYVGSRRSRVYMQKFQTNRKIRALTNLARAPGWRLRIDVFGCVCDKGGFGGRYGLLLITKNWCAITILSKPRKGRNKIKCEYEWLAQTDGFSIINNIFDGWKIWRRRRKKYMNWLRDAVALHLFQYGPDLLQYAWLVLPNQVTYPAKSVLWPAIANATVLQYSKHSKN